MSASSQQALDTRLERALRETRVPGLILAVAQPGKPPLARGYGLQDGKPIAPTLPAMLCSLCKPLTAQAFLVLVQEGKLRLSDPAAQWLPCDPRITLLHLLTHRSGLPAKFPEGLRAPTEAERVKQALTEPLLFAPGASFLYSNVGYQSLGRILESVTGQRPDKFIQTRLLDPLGIKSYFVATYLSPAEQKRYDSGMSPLLTPQHFDKETGAHTPVRDRFTSLAHEAVGSADTCGAGCMSAPDFLKLLLSVTPAQRQLIRRNAQESYGLGWMLRDGGLAHTGTGSGETHYALTRESGMSYVCFIPSSNDDACEKLLSAVQSAVKYGV
ncbi:MAG: serine hydrolase [Armatimonadetes bacterium]|nr:serine hydrolase [Armatimonadota bacterium]